MRTSSLPRLVAVALSWGLGACGEERPPAPPRPAQPAASEQTAAPVTAVYATDTPAVLTYAGPRGAFVDTHDPASVPEGVRGFVRVTLLDGKAPPPGTVWVANLDDPLEDGTYRLVPVPRASFEELALGQGLSSAVTLPEGLEPPDLPATHGDIIVYKTSWCGVCKKLQAYLDRKGVEYVAKDIEADRAAAAELAAKLKKAGARGGSVPVIDLRGQIIVGFDRARLERELSAALPPPSPATPNTPD